MMNNEQVSSSSEASNSSSNQQSILLPFLKKSKISLFLSHLLKFSTFLNTSMQPYTIYSAVVFTIHMIQYWALSLFMFDLCIWDQNSLSGNTISVLALFLRLYPAFKDIKYITTISLTFIIFYTAILVFIIVTAKMFSKNNHINQFIVTCCSYLIPFLGFISQPIAVTAIVELFFLPEKSFYEYFLAIFSIVILILFSILYILNCSWSVFIVSPLPVLRDSFRLTNYFSIITIAIFSTLAGHVGKAVKIVLYVLMIVIYISCFLLTARYALLQKRVLESILFGVTLSSITGVIVNGVYSLTKSTPPNYIIFVEILIIFVGIFGYTHYLVRCAVRNLNILDEMSENNSVISEYSNHFVVNSGACGFIDKHPFCTSLLIFQRAINNSQTRDVWLLLLYAKYLCIYPQYFAELSRILDLITKCHSQFFPNDIFHFK